MTLYFLHAKMCELAALEWGSEKKSYLYKYILKKEIYMMSGTWGIFFLLRIVK